MAWRLYFVVGDILACVSVGAAGAWLAAMIVPGDWFMPAAMAVGMIAGMIVGLVGTVAFSPFFGSHEVMLPSMLTGMLAGMASGMIDAMAGIGWKDAVWGGGLVGLLCLFATYLLQLRLRGEAN